MLENIEELFLSFEIQHYTTRNKTTTHFINLPTPQIALSSKLFTRAQLLLYNDERINHPYHAASCFPAIKILPRSRADVHGDEL